MSRVIDFSIVLLCGVRLYRFPLKYARIRCSNMAELAGVARICLSTLHTANESIHMPVLVAIISIQTICFVFTLIVNHFHPSEIQLVCIQFECATQFFVGVVVVAAFIRYSFQHFDFPKVKNMQYIANDRMRLKMGQICFTFACYAVFVCARVTFGKFIILPDRL